ncbi:MAG TPA: hypothetical protein VM490_08070 [Armatimonadaceae bacterium]|nr:hypothetical protein [Armatimonadaceae bacterium]
MANEVIAAESRAHSTDTTPYIVVGIVAAAVSAAVAAYVFWTRSRSLGPHVESVQDLLEQAHDKMRSIEQKLGDLQAPKAGSAA